MDHLSERLKNLLNQFEKLNLTFDKLKSKNDDLELNNKNLRDTLSLKEEKIKAAEHERLLRDREQRQRDEDLRIEEEAQKRLDEKNAIELKQKTTVVCMSISPQNSDISVKAVSKKEPKQRAFSVVHFPCGVYTVLAAYSPLLHWNHGWTDGQPVVWNAHGCVLQGQPPGCSPWT